MADDATESAAPPTTETPEGLDAVTIAANAVADRLDARVFLYSGSIDSQGCGSLVSEMQVAKDRPHRPNSVLVLTTYGGYAGDAYRIARVMQLTSKRFVLCIPNICKSAGTLIALGAHQIMMNDISEIGPLDVQLRQRDEIGQVRSGMVVRTALKGLAEETFSAFETVMLKIKDRSQHSVSLEVASRIASDIAAEVMTPIYAQIDPYSLGKDLRDLDIATAYGERLSRHGTNVLNGTIRQLIEGYPSHDFIIDKKETETLFHRVDSLTDEMSALTRSLGSEVYSPQWPLVVKRLDRKLEEPHEENQDALESEPSGLDVGRQADGNGDQGGE